MSNQDRYQVNITPNTVANIKEIIDFYVETMSYPPAANYVYGLTPSERPMKFNIE